MDGTLHKNQNYPTALPLLERADELLTREVHISTTHHRELVQKRVII